MKKISAIQAAKERCPYWIQSMRVDWKNGFCYAANGHFDQNSEDGDSSVWSYGYRAGKEWRQQEDVDRIDPAHKVISNHEKEI